jgi:hypothetical protein
MKATMEIEVRDVESIPENKLNGVLHLRPPEMIVIVLRHRPMWKRILLFPRTFLGHYLIFRRTRVSVRTSVVASWGLARLLFLRVK